MNANVKVAEAIRQIISNLMNRVMEKVLVNDPFIPEEHHAKKPLYAALVPDEIFKGSHFERRFVTPFGSVWKPSQPLSGTDTNCHISTNVEVYNTANR